MNTTISDSCCFRPIPVATILPGRPCDAPRAVASVEARSMGSRDRLEPGCSARADRAGHFVWLVFWTGSWSVLIGCACQILGR